MKRTLLTFMLILLVISIVACRKPADQSSDTTTAGGSSATTTGPELVLPEGADYGGYTFTVYTRKGTNGFYAETQTLDTVNDALYNRLKQVSELLSVEFELIESTDKYGIDAMVAISAGEDAYDIVVPHARYAFAFAHAELALDWNTDLPNVDLDAAWWSQDMRENFTILNKLYVMGGDINHENFAATHALFFNKVIFDENNWDYPYQMVIDGEWTFDRLEEYVKNSNKELNGDNALDIDNDRMGYATSWWGTPINILFTAGQRILTKNEEGALQLTVNSTRTAEIFERFFNFMEDPGCYLHLEDNADVIKTAFKSGRLTFYPALLKEGNNLRDMEDDFGIIPNPKFDETMETYITGVDAGTGLIVVPTTAGDPERTSTILEALAYYGWRDIVPTYYNVVLGGKVVRDDESITMLEIIRGSRMYDTGYFYATQTFPMAMSSIGYYLSKSADHSFASHYAKYESAALTAIAQINQFYEADAQE